MLIDHDGTVGYLDEPAGLLIGLGDHDGGDGVTELAPGATLLLYTDGLVETRGRSIADGLAQLGRHAADSPSSPRGSSRHTGGPPGVGDAE